MAGTALFRSLSTAVKISDPIVVTLACRDKRHFLIKTLLCTRSQLLSCWKSGWLHWSWKTLILMCEFWHLPLVSLRQPGWWQTGLGLLYGSLHRWDARARKLQHKWISSPWIFSFMLESNPAFAKYKHLTCNKEPCCSLSTYSCSWTERGGCFWDGHRDVLLFLPWCRDGVFTDTEKYIAHPHLSNFLF